MQARFFALSGMLYLLLLIITVFIATAFRISLFTELKPLSHFLHSSCLAQVPLWSEHYATLAALTCGKPLESSAKYLYATAGLIHLFVVSGSHLTLVAKIFENLFTHKEENIVRTLTKLILLFLYCGACLFSPPVLRSFVFLILLSVYDSKKRRWPRHYLILLAGLITMIVHPPWIQSLGLQMSWLAGLTLEVHRKYLRKHPYVLPLLFYIIFSASFSALGFPELTTVPVSIIFAPILEGVLFPLAILTTVCHVTEPIYSVVLNSLNRILASLELFAAQPSVSVESVIMFNWIVIAGIHFVMTGYRNFEGARSRV